LHEPVVVNGRLDRRGLEAVGALLTVCGFDLKGGDASSFLRQARAAWRARHDQVLRLRAPGGPFA
jgi:hypothetical protein